MNHLAILNFENHQVRTVTDDQNRKWFVANDVAESLDYAKPDKAIQEYVPEKYTSIISTETKTGAKEIKYISLEGLFKLLTRSRQPKAEVFSDWVCEEVLPSVYHTGAYVDQARFSPEQFAQLTKIVADTNEYFTTDYVAHKIQYAIDHPEDHSNGSHSMQKTFAACAHIIVKEYKNDVPGGNQKQQNLFAAAMAFLSRDQHRGEPYKCQKCGTQVKFSRPQKLEL